MGLAARPGSELREIVSTRLVGIQMGRVVLLVTALKGSGSTLLKGTPRDLAALPGIKFGMIGSIRLKDIPTDRAVPLGFTSNRNLAAHNS